MSHNDITIIGGGIIGLLTAIVAAKEGLSCSVIEKRNPENLFSKQADGRVSAIALGSKSFLDKYGLWSLIKKSAGPIHEIRVTDNNSPFFLHFDHQDVSDEPLGFMVENAVLLEMLYKQAELLENLTIVSPAHYTKIERTRDNATVTLDDDKNSFIESRLIIAADGRHSNVRQSAHIKTSYYSYGQTGIVCNVEHTLPHCDTAVEHFMPSGPFAILPMHGGHQSSIVWTEKTEDANYLLSLPQDKLLLSLEKRFGDFLGKIKIISPIFNYPLGLTTVKSYTSHRLALVGDAAHGIHPIAGQGLNLGIRDIEALIPTIKNYNDLGLDIGQSQCLKSYSNKRTFDVESMITITHQLNALFANDIPTIKVMRRLGLATVDTILPLKKFFMRRAMGMNRY